MLTRNASEQQQALPSNSSLSSSSYRLLADIEEEEATQGASSLILADARSEDESHVIRNDEANCSVFHRRAESRPRFLSTSGWDQQTVWDWYNQLPFLVGFNYLPSTAVNFVEMWQESTFHPHVISRELSWARQCGYNTLRTNIPMIVWEDDPEGLMHRINLFLEIAAENCLSVMLCPLDDCEFGGESAKLGPQPDPVPGLHNSRAIGSPGRNVVLDPSQWHRVESYIRYVIRTWGGDSRILVWDLYNEPGNGWTFHKNGTRFIPDFDRFEKNALKLMERVFVWAREEHPLQPLTTSAWHMPDPFFEGAEAIAPLAHPIDQRAMQLSDVVTIHAYCNKQVLRSTLAKAALMGMGKPIMLTEWMARQCESTFESLLPILKEHNVGSYQWGLVKGRTQTYLPWPHVAERFEGASMWFHDVLNADGTVHDVKEMEFLKHFCITNIRKIDSNMHLLHLPGADHHENKRSLEQGDDRTVDTAAISMNMFIRAMSSSALLSSVASATTAMQHHQPMAALPDNLHSRTPSMDGIQIGQFI